MKKDIQRAALAAIVATLAIMTGCEHSNKSSLKAPGAHGQAHENEMQHGQKPQPPHTRKYHGDLESQPHHGNSHMDSECHTQNQTHGQTNRRSQMENKSRGKQSGRSQYHHYNN